MSERRSKGKYRPGLYCRVAARDWFGRPWRGPLYVRAGRWRHDLVTVVGQLEAMVRAGGSLVEGLEAAAREERRLLNRPSHKTAAQVVQMALMIVGALAVGGLLYMVRTEEGWILYWELKELLSYPRYPGLSPGIYDVAWDKWLTAPGIVSGIFTLGVVVWVRVHSGAREAVLVRLRDSIAKGVPLSVAMGRMGRFFPSSCADLVGAAEVSGGMEEALHEVGQEAMSGLARRAGLQHHLVYFLAVVSLQLALLGYLGWSTVPNLEEGNRPLYIRELPDPDNPAGGEIQGYVVEGEFDTPAWGGRVFGWLKGMAESGYPLSFRGYATAVGGLVVVAWWLAWRRKRPAASRALVCASSRGLPVVRQYVVARNVALSARLLRRLLEAEMPLPDALRQAGAADVGRRYARALGAAAERVEAGDGLAQALDGWPGLFPEGFRALVRVGERSGMLAEAMGQGAERYEREVERVTAALYDSVVPACVLVVGAVSLAVVSAVYEYHVAFVDVMLKMVD